MEIFKRTGTNELIGFEGGPEIAPLVSEVYRRRLESGKLSEEGVRRCAERLISLANPPERVVLPCNDGVLQAILRIHKGFVEDMAELADSSMPMDRLRERLAERTTIQDLADQAIQEFTIAEILIDADFHPDFLDNPPTQD